MTRQRLILAAAALVALVGAFGAGRFSRPARIVTKDVVHVETRTVEVAKTVTVHDQADVKDTAEKVRTVTVVRTRWLPGGVVEKEATTQAATDTTAKETRQEHAGATKDVSRASVALRDESHVREATARPSWSVSLLPGVDLTGRSGLPYHAVVGASLERRILGPLFIGLHGNSAGVVGAIVRMEF